MSVDCNLSCIWNNGNIVDLPSNYINYSEESRSTPFHVVDVVPCFLTVSTSYFFCQLRSLGSQILTTEASTRVTNNYKLPPIFPKRHPNNRVQNQGVENGLTTEENPTSTTEEIQSTTEENEKDSTTEQIPTSTTESWEDNPTIQQIIASTTESAEDELTTEKIALTTEENERTTEQILTSTIGDEDEPSTEQMPTSTTENTQTTSRLLNILTTFPEGDDDRHVRI